MKKIILAVLIIGVLVLLEIFYFGFHNYFIEDKVNEALPSMPPDMAQPFLQEPIIVKQGNFVDADFFHKGIGKAYILEYPDGRRILRFENFEVVNGPDVYVYLSPATMPSNSLNSLGDFIELGRLKGNVGDQNYELSGIDLQKYNSVVLWCKRFEVLFPYAVIK